MNLARLSAAAGAASPGPLSGPVAPGPVQARRRELLLAGGSAALLVACGGGGSMGDVAIDSFSAERSALFVGERARLTATFRGGSGRIEPGVGPVASGVPVTTPVLDRDTTYRLVVESPGHPPLSRTLGVTVDFRDRYALHAGAFTGSQHSATAAADGSVILVGGVRGTATAAAIDRFDPRSGTVSRLGTLSAARHAHRATRLVAGRILVSGGMAGTEVLGSAELVDERSGEAVAAGSMSMPRVAHAALALVDGRVLVSGGLGGTGASDTAELWDPATQRFRRVAQRMQIARWAHTMSLLPDGRVLVVGGYGPAEYRFAEVFDPRAETFAALPETQPWRASHEAHVEPDGCVLVLGGETLGRTEWGETVVATASVLRFDPARGRFEALPPLHAPRTWASSVMLPSGQVLLFGGQHELPAYTGSVERYDPRQGGRVVAALDGDRALHTATRLADGRVLVVGGEASGGGYRPNALVYE